MFFQGDSVRNVIFEKFFTFRCIWSAQKRRSVIVHVATYVSDHSSKYRTFRNLVCVNSSGRIIPLFTPWKLNLEILHRFTLKSVRFFDSLS